MINKTTVEIKNPVFFMDEIISALEQKDISGEEMQEILEKIFELVFWFVKNNPYESLRCREFEYMFGKIITEQSTFAEIQEHYGNLSMYRHVFSFGELQKLKKIHCLLKSWEIITDIEEAIKVTNMELIITLLKREMRLFKKFFQVLNMTSFNTDIGEKR